MRDLTDEYYLCKKMREVAYSPYSKYTVGATLVCKNGKKYTGCNIENNGIQSICAERVAFAKAISEGEKDFEYIVILGGEKEKDESSCTPCGYCRQFMSEFVDDSFEIYNIHDNKTDMYTMNELLPHKF